MSIELLDVSGHKLESIIISVWPIRIFFVSVDFAFPKPGESLLECYYNYRDKADAKVCCDYALHMCLPRWSDDIKKDMEKLCKEHGEPSLKWTFEVLINYFRGELI